MSNREERALQREAVALQVYIKLRRALFCSEWGSAIPKDVFILMRLLEHAAL